MTYKNQKGVALVTVMIAIVVITLIVTMLIKLLVNELTGNKKIIEVAEARYEAEGMIEEERYLIFKNIKDTIDLYSETTNPDTNPIPLTPYNPGCSFSDEHTFQLSFVQPDETSPIHWLQEVIFSKVPVDMGNENIIRLTCSNNDPFFSITANLKISVNLHDNSVYLDYISIERSE